MDKIEVFAFALVGLVAFAMTVEGYWDRRLYIIERLFFGISCYLLLSRDKMIGIREDFFHGQTQLVHLIGLALFVLMMVYHKISTKRQNQILEHAT